LKIRQKIIKYSLRASEKASQIWQLVNHPVLRGHMEKFTRAAQALSDSTRLRILNVLMEHECGVCEVMQAMDISQTRASRNLKILGDAGFLNMRTDGLYTLYTRLKGRRRIPCRASRSRKKRDAA
jgi:DNA-binding transcriptional ArsR family regulator